MLYNKVKCSNCVFNEHNISNEYKWIVYMHVFPNNKRYVGITHYKDPTQRWGVDGTNYIGQYVYSGISKYGWDNVRHIINTIKHYCYRLNAPHLKSFNSCISTHIKNNKFKEPLRKQGTRIKYIINADIYVVPLDKDEIKLFY